MDRGACSQLDRPLADAMGQMRLISGLLLHLSFDCWLASRGGAPEVLEDLYRQLIRTSYAFQTSLEELRDALLMSNYRGSAGKP